MAVFEAKYGGKCGRCGDYFPAGAPVEYVDDVLVAADHNCEPGPEETPESVRRDRCPQCYLIHAGECL